ELRTGRGEVGYPAEIEDEQRRVRRFAGEFSRDVVNGGEIERTDQLDHADVAVALVEDLLLVRLAAAARGDAKNVVIGDDAGAEIGASLEHMEVEARRQRLANLQAAHAVEVAVEKWRERSKPELRRQRRDDAAADATFRRDADAIDPFAGVVIHARARHHRKRSGHDVRGDHLHAGNGIDV